MIQMPDGKPMEMEGASNALPSTTLIISYRSTNSNTLPSGSRQNSALRPDLLRV